MILKLPLFFLLAWFAAMPVAAAATGARANLGEAANLGTLGMMPTEDWATPLSDAEMAGIRGGYSGLAFGVFFTGYYDRVGAVNGSLTVTEGGSSPTPSPTFTAQDGEVRLSTSIGNFNGASGIFQIAQVPGSFNVVNNNLYVQIAVVNVLNGTPVPSLASLFGPAH